MDADGQERIKKAYARLYGLKEGIRPPKNSEYLDSAQAKDFNRAIDHLVAEGFDVNEFRIQDDEIVAMAFGGPAVRFDTFITRLHAVLAYFTVNVTEGKTPEDLPIRKIGFEGPRRS